MMTVTNERRVIIICDCCREALPTGDNIPDVWRQAQEQGWIKTASGNQYCAPCAKGMGEK